MLSIFQTTKTNRSPEEEQIKAAQQNPGQFNVLYQQYYKPIFRFVYQRLNSKEDAADISSQVFLKAMLNINKYEFKGLPFSSWLYRIALNELNMNFRHEKVQRAYNSEQEHLKEMITELNEKDSLDREQQLMIAITDLDADDAQLIEMRYFEKRSFKEIAEIMDITENNAKVKTYRVIDKLKKRLKN
jgi:RNA polymerase sigma-70 factor (ECF subfamily)